MAHHGRSGGGREGKGYSVWEITSLKKHDDREKAREILQRVANHVEPLMKKYKWRVKLLAEFSPKNPNLLGVNINRSTIKIRCTRALSMNCSTSFYPYEHTLGTMLHELTHMRVGPHNAKFYALLDTLRTEMETLMAQGPTLHDPPHGLSSPGSPRDHSPAFRQAYHNRHIGLTASPSPLRLA